MTTRQDHAGRAGARLDEVSVLAKPNAGATLRTPQSSGVLLVEDHAALADLTRQMLEALGRRVVGPARSIEEARRLAERERPAIALLDVRLPDGSGIDLVEEFRALGIASAVVSGYADPGASVVRPEGVAWLEKPLDAETLRDALARLDGRA